jgi:YHS domain-containing protein
MSRAILELLFSVLIIVIARSLLTNFFSGIANASRSFQNTGAQNRNDEPAASAGGKSQHTSTNELHKDPVCGTYVAESTPFQRNSSGQVFYYCSTQCREKHSLVAR